MDSKFLNRVILGLVFATLGTETIATQAAAVTEDCPGSVMPVNGVVKSTDGDLNFKTFEVEVTREGDYFTEFWLIPAKYPNGNYTTFMVYVNGEYVGEIVPTKGNWQAARVDGKGSLRLVEGTNRITVATRAPEFPEVETLKVASCESDAIISSKEYEEFLYEVEQGLGISTQYVESSDTYAADNGMKHFSNVPLEYTFYIVASFTKGQDINIMSSSKGEHVIDMVIQGYKKSYVFVPEGSASPDATIPGTPGGGKMVMDYEHASSEEMQGLNWKGISEQVINPNSTTQLATVRTTAPKTGLYLIRLRAKADGGAATGNLYINGAYSYENVPITFHSVNCVIPADGNHYASMTCCDDFGTDDPVLFIHGAAADRLVGFNDDGAKEMVARYNLSEWDSYISQTYLMPTTRMSVSSYSSSKPRSKCSILARVAESDSSLALGMEPRGLATSGRTGLSIENGNVVLPGTVDIEGTLTVSASIPIQKITVYGMAGNLTGSLSCGENSVVVSAAALHMTQPGLYVISVETTDGVTSKKILVK